MSLIIFYEIKFLRKNCRDVHVTPIAFEEVVSLGTRLESANGME